MKTGSITFVANSLSTYQNNQTGTISTTGAKMKLKLGRIREMLLASVHTHTHTLI